MAKKSKLNTNLDEDSVKHDDVAVAEIDEIEPNMDEMASESVDDTKYAMGTIVAEGVEEEEAPAKDTSAASDDEEDEVWVEEDINLEDTDPFMEMADYDMDNPYSDDDDTY